MRITIEQLQSQPNLRCPKGEVTVAIPADSPGAAQKSTEASYLLNKQNIHNRIRYNQLQRTIDVTFTHEN